MADAYLEFSSTPQSVYDHLPWPYSSAGASKNSREGNSSNCWTNLSFLFDLIKMVLQFKNAIYFQASPYWTVCSHPYHDWSTATKLANHNGLHVKLLFPNKDFHISLSLHLIYSNHRIPFSNITRKWGVEQRPTRFHMNAEGNWYNQAYQHSGVVIPLISQPHAGLFIIPALYLKNWQWQLKKLPHSFLSGHNENKHLQ